MGGVASAIGGVLGNVGSSVNTLLGGGANNMNFTAQNAPIQNPLQQGQLQTGFQNTNQALTGEQQLALALQNQNGLGNQNQVYNQLQQIAAGQGPNPALAQLNQATGQNVANQAALMAGQRGAGANAGLIARQSAQQGAAAQQNAIGQAAALQAQQQANAINAAGNMANQQVANQLAGQSGLTQAQLANQAQLLGAQQGYNQQLVSNAAQQNSANAGIAAQNARNTAGAIGGLANGLGGALSGVFSGGGGLSDSALLGSMTSGGGEAIAGGAGDIVGGSTLGADIAAAGPLALAAHGGRVPEHLAKMHELWHGGAYAHGGKVDIITSPGEKYVNPKEAKEVAQGKKSLKDAGHKIPGKAAVKGDSYKNDTHPMKAEAGGIVIPRSIMQSKDPVKEGTKFLVEQLKKHGGKKEESEFHGALKKAIAARG